MKTKGIFLSWIVVEDIQKAIKFYTETAGLKLMEFHEAYKWAELSGPEGQILGIGEFNEHSEIKAGQNAVVTLSVDDIESAKQHFIEKGAKLIGEIMEVPGHVKMQTFSDMDGNIMQLVEKMSHQPV